MFHMFLIRISFLCDGEVRVCVYKSVYARVCVWEKERDVTRSSWFSIITIMIIIFTRGKE